MAIIFTFVIQFPSLAMSQTTLLPVDNIRTEKDFDGAVAVQELAS